MSKHSVTTSRWQEAQKFEIDEWLADESVVKSEQKELEEKFSKVFPKIAAEIKLNENDEVLDLGCGPTVPALLLKTGKITGLEPLAKSLGVEGRNKVPGVTIITGKGEKMPFKDRGFRLVLCRNVIDHTNDPAKVVSEVRRVLKKDGYFLLICYTYSPFITWIKNISERVGLLNNVGHPFTFTPATLESLISNQFSILKRFTFHTGIDSTDYGKTGIKIKDNSLIHKILIWINKNLFGYSWFLKEYGLLTIKR